MENQILLSVGAIISLLACFLLGKEARKKPESHNFMAFFLWGILDGITAISIFLKDPQNGSWLLMCFYSLGCLGIALMLYLINPSRKIIGVSELIIIFFILIIFIIWYKSKDIVIVTVTSVIMSLLAGWLEIKNTSEQPDKNTKYVWQVFFIGAFITFLGGKGWKSPEDFIEQRLCALANGLEAIVLWRLSSRKTI